MLEMVQTCVMRTLGAQKSTGPKMSDRVLWFEAHCAYKLFRRVFPDAFHSGVPQGCQYVRLARRFI